MMCDAYLLESASAGSPGMESIKWLKPVRPGDRLSVRMTILETTRSRSKPDRGVVRSLVEVLNQERAVVMSVKTMVLSRCRAAAVATTGGK